MKGSLARALTIAIAIMVCNGEHSDFSFKAIFNGFMRFGNGPQRKDTNAQSMGTPVPTRLATTTPIPTTLAITTPIPTTVAMTTPAPVVPNPPENLEVSRVDSTSFSVTWTKPVSGDNGITGYIVYYEKANGSSTILPYDSATFNTTVRDLLPCQSYTVWVTAMYGETEGPMPEKLLVTTLPARPDVVNSTYAHNVQVSEVTWTAPFSHCEIANYTISWTIQEIRDYQVDPTEESMVVDSNTLAYTISVSDIMYYANYTYCIKATIVEGLEGEPFCESFMTPAGMPTVVRNIEAVANSNGTITWSWDSPEDLNGPYQGFQLIYGIDHLEKIDIKPEYIRNHRYSYNVNASVPNRQYKAYVAVKYGDDQVIFDAPIKTVYSACPANFVRINDDCYLFGTQSMAFNDGLAFCSDFGASYISLKPYDEDFVNALTFTAQNTGGKFWLYSMFIGSIYQWGIGGDITLDLPPNSFNDDKCNPSEVKCCVYMERDPLYFHSIPCVSVDPAAALCKDRRSKVLTY